MVESIPSMFHLRRVQFQAYVKEAKGRSASEPINDALGPSAVPTVRERSTMILLDKQTKIGRNPELVDVVLHSVVHSNMISRDHSEIIGETDEKGQFARYYISDRSLNGTYVNDTRVKENVLLREGDLIKFGHVNGAAIKPGEHAPQHTAEFIFRFERAIPDFAYFGYSQKGVRVHQNNEQRRAYMQINSDRVLPTEVYASTSSLAVGAGGAVPKTLASTANAVNASTSSSAVHPNHASSSSSSGTSAQSGGAVTSSNNATTANSTNQLAHLAAVAAATTLANTAATAAINHNNNAQHQQAASGGNNNNVGGAAAASALSALNQLGLTSATDEQVAAVNAHLRQLMASHDAMSAMERLAAQQQWNNSLFKLSSLQQQNPLVYGHAFPAAAAAAAALFTGCIDLNSAANNSNAAAQYAAAASLWPNIRALQPSAAQATDWTQQQKAAALAQQLQLRLPGSMSAALYQQSQQQRTSANHSSLFGTPSAFTLPGSQMHAGSNSSSLPSSSAGLLIAAQQHCGPSASCSASAAYSSCTSSVTTSVPVPVPMRPSGESPISSLSRGASSVSLPIHQQSTTDQQQQSTAALAARLAAAQQLAKELEADQHSKSWAMGIACSSAAGPSIPATKVSPVIGSATGSVVGGGGSSTLQRIPGIASALAAAVAAAQHQQQQMNNGTANVVQQQHQQSWPSGGGSGTPPTTNHHPPPTMLSTPPIQQPLAQRLFSSSTSTSSSSTAALNSSTLSMCSGSSKSSSGISSAPSTGTLLQSPSVGGTHGENASGLLNNGDVSKELRDSFSSLNNSSSGNSAFTPPNPQLANNTTLNTLTAAMFAAEREKAGAGITHQQKQSGTAIKPGEIKRRTMSREEKETARKTLKRGKNDRELNDHHTNADQKATLNGSSSSISTDLGHLQLETIKNEETHREMVNQERRMTLEARGEPMECDSSVPSPPSGKTRQPRLDSTASTTSATGDIKGQEKDDSDEPPMTRRKRFSASRSSSEPIEDEQDRKKSDSNKPRPIKQARKSNEVARLLNDLTAGNCSWQYMAERSQKLAAKVAQQGDKNRDRGEDATSKSGRSVGEKQTNQQTERKKPMRLEERKRAEMERKRAHKMMRQISDESSDEEGGGGVKKESNLMNSNESNNHVGKDEKSRHQDKIKLGTSMSTTSDDEEEAKWAESNSDGEDRVRHHRNIGKEKIGTNSDKATLLNGGTSSTTTVKRKLLSSAPGTKKAGSLLNNMAKLTNGKPKEGAEGPKKRGPKGAEEKKKIGRESKKLLPSTSNSVLKKKPGRKERGRPTAHNHKSKEGESDNSDLSDGSSADEFAGLTNGGGPMIGKGMKKKGRKPKALSGKSETQPDLAMTTIAEDWTGGSGDPELCAHKECQRPLHMAINWVQCDDCDQWFHSTCVFGTNSMPDDDADFHCGCKTAKVNNTDGPAETAVKIASNGSTLSSAS